MQTAATSFGNIRDSMEPALLPWWSPFPAPEGITVTQVDLTPDAGREGAAFAWLDSVERARWEKYLSAPRRRFTLCRAALRAILCEQLGCRNERLSFGELEHGKPFALVDGHPAPVSFNLSHSGERGLIAFAASGRLGIDLEEIAPRRHLESLIEAVMGPAERAELDALAGPQKLRQFYRFWTCKEALIKALGDGFSTDVSRLEIPANLRHGATAGIFRFPRRPAEVWQLEDIGNSQFAAALAWKMTKETGQPDGLLPPGKA